VSWCVNRFSLTLLQQDKILGEGHGTFYGGLDDLSIPANGGGY
jgi:hypothetical protein